MGEDHQRTPQKLSVIAPVYRSRSILPQLVKRVTDALGARDHEIVLVHDCGPDGSWSVIESLSREYSTVVGVNLRRNVGQHNALMAGLNHASGDIIVTIDDDLQHAPEDILKLVAEIEKGYDLCYSSFRSRKHALWKRLGSKLNDTLAVVLLDKPKGLYLSPFKAMKREVRDEVIKYGGPSVYLDGLLLSVTSNIASVEVDHHERADGNGGYTFRRSVSLLLKMSTISSILPLRLATLAGFGFAGLGALLTIAFVIQRFIWNAMPVGWSSIVVTSLILGGVQLVALGMIGEYVGRIFLEVRKRPQFTVAATTRQTGRSE
jgi:polyisoprenyl-phosphate glycosyltransferase